MNGFKVYDKRKGRLHRPFPLFLYLNPADDTKIDNPKYKAQFGKKAEMLTSDEIETLIGHAVGGVCPFAINHDVTVHFYIIENFQTVFPTCGSSNSAIELTIEEFEKYSSFAELIDFCKGWNVGA